jgi:hypothetical protein
VTSVQAAEEDERGAGGHPLAAARAMRRARAAAFRRPRQRDAKHSKGTKLIANLTESRRLWRGAVERLSTGLVRGVEVGGEHRRRRWEAVMSTKKGPWPRVRRGIRGARLCGTGKLSDRLKSEGHHWPYSARRGERAPSALAPNSRLRSKSAKSSRASCCSHAATKEHVQGRRLTTWRVRGRWRP